MSFTDLAPNRWALNTGPILKALGETYFLENKLELTEEILNKALELFQQNNHPEAYGALETLAELYIKKAVRERDKKNIKQSQEYKKLAIICLKQAFEIASTYLPEDSPHIERIQSKLKHQLPNIPLFSEPLF